MPINKDKLESKSTVWPVLLHYYSAKARTKLELTVRFIHC